MSGFTDKVAIVTGAANGSAGPPRSSLACQVRKSRLSISTGTAASARLGSAGGRRQVHRDRRRSRQRGACERMVAETQSAFGPLDLAFNNAGIVSMGTALADVDEATLDRIIAINLKSIFLCLKDEIAAMLAAGRGGAIVNTASTAGVRGVVGLSSYSASKHGVVGLTKSPALEYAKHGVRVNAVCPGGVDTKMYQSIKHLVNESTINPMGRPGTPTSWQVLRSISSRPEPRSSPAASIWPMARRRRLNGRPAPTGRSLIKRFSPFIALALVRKETNTTKGF